MSNYTIYLIGGSEAEKATLITNEEGDGDLCYIVFHYQEKKIEVEAPDYFEAFCRIREDLEKENLTPFCYGASLNVYPSPMSRGMGGGIKAYKLTSGVNAKSQDLVNIFDSAKDVVPASVFNQKQYYNDWLSSLKN